MRNAHIPPEPDRPDHGTPPEHDFRPLVMTSLGAVALLFCGIGGWSATAQLSGAVIAPGTVVVETSVKKIQHPSGGIVGDILVKDGAKVMAGDVLVRLDHTATRANLQIINRQLDELDMRNARIELELTLGPLLDGAKEFELPPQFAERAQDAYVASLYATEKIAYDARRATCSSQNSQYGERIAQLKEEVAGLDGQMVANTQEIAFIDAEIKGLEQLESMQLVTTAKMVERRRQAARLTGQQSQLRASAAQSRGKIVEIELQKLSHFQEQRTDLVKERREIQGKQGELRERQLAAEDQLRRTDIRAPQSGLVHELAIHTIGGVIEPGEQIMLIVPDEDDLSVEVEIRPTDIDQVSVGQKSRLRFSGLHQVATREITGTVTRIGADLSRAADGTRPSHFLARVSFDAEGLRTMKGRKLLPGMPVEIYLETGKHTAMSYLVKPFVDQLKRAFRES